MGIFAKIFGGLQSLGVPIPAFSVAGIVKQLIQYLSDVVKLLEPDQLTPAQLETLQDLVGSLYAFGKNFGARWVADSLNDLDDAILKELLEICEQAATKYSLELNPVAILLP